MNSWKGVKIWTLGIGSVLLDEFKLLSCQNWRIYLQGPLQGPEESTAFHFKAIGPSFAWAGCLMENISSLWVY